MQNPTPDFTLQPLQPQYQSQARELILAGLAEHWDSFDLDKNPDLEDISTTYSQAVFLVALQQERVIATGALIPAANGTAQVVRMSVATEMRRKGVASAMLQALCTRARELGMQQLILETTETWQGAIAFYRDFGFTETHHLNGDVFFMFDL